MMKTDYLKGRPEAEIAGMAKNGDKNAVEFLWIKYKKPMANVFWNLPMTPGERESEAADVFMHYVMDLFDPDKEENQKEGWAFFPYLYSGMLGRRSKLRKARTHLSYDESECEIESGSGALNAEMVSLSNRDLYTRYDPEQAVISELCMNSKIRQVHDSIKQVQEMKAEYFRYIFDHFIIPETEGKQGAFNDKG